MDNGNLKSQNHCIALVEDRQADAQAIKRLLTTRFDVVWYRSIYEILDQYLRGIMPSINLFLIDIRLPDPKYPQLEGTSLATWISNQMILGNIPEAFLIAYTAKISEDIELESNAAGCMEVWEKPFSTPHIQRLIELVPEIPVVRSEFNRWQNIIRRHHINLINDVILNPIPSMDISSEDIHALLSLLYRVNCPRDRQDRRAELCDQIGGTRLLRQIIETALIDVDADLQSVSRLLTRGETQLAISEELRISRRQLDNQMDRIYCHISERLRRGISSTIDSK